MTNRQRLLQRGTVELHYRAMNAFGTALEYGALRAKDAVLEGLPVRFLVAEDEPGTVTGEELHRTGRAQRVVMREGIACDRRRVEIDRRCIDCRRHDPTLPERLQSSADAPQERVGGHVRRTS